MKTNDAALHHSENKYSVAARGDQSSGFSTPQKGRRKAMLRLGYMRPGRGVAFLQEVAAMAA